MKNLNNWLISVLLAVFIVTPTAGYCASCYVKAEGKYKISDFKNFQADVKHVIEQYFTCVSKSDWKNAYLFLHTEAKKNIDINGFIEKLEKFKSEMGNLIKWNFGPEKYDMDEFSARMKVHSIYEKDDLTTTFTIKKENNEYKILEIYAPII